MKSAHKSIDEFEYASPAYHHLSLWPLFQTRNLIHWKIRLNRPYFWSRLPHRGISTVFNRSWFIGSFNWWICYVNIWASEYIKFFLGGGEGGDGAKFLIFTNDSLLLLSIFYFLRQHTNFLKYHSDLNIAACMTAIICECITFARDKLQRCKLLDRKSERHKKSAQKSRNRRVNSMFELSNKSMWNITKENCWLVNKTFQRSANNERKLSIELKFTNCKYLFLLHIYSKFQEKKICIKLGKVFFCCEEIIYVYGTCFWDV